VRGLEWEVLLPTNSLRSLTSDDGDLLAALGVEAAACGGRGKLGGDDDGQSRHGGNGNRGAKHGELD
jgi:hypothetical protein